MYMLIYQTYHQHKWSEPPILGCYVSGCSQYVEEGACGRRFILPVHRGHCQHLGSRKINTNYYKMNQGLDQAYFFVEVYRKVGAAPTFLMDRAI